MKKTTVYLGIKQVSYEFTEDDILRALMKYFDIPGSRDMVFGVYEDWYDGQHDKTHDAYAELVVRHVEDANSQNGKDA